MFANDSNNNINLEIHNFLTNQNIGILFLILYFGVARFHYTTVTKSNNRLRAHSDDNPAIRLAIIRVVIGGPTLKCHISLI